MPTDSATHDVSSTTRTESHRRYWRRTETPRPWWPWGLLPLLGLVGLFLFGALITAPAIQAEVRSSVSQRLDSAGIGASEVAANGQAITLYASAAAPDDGMLEDLAESTTCRTWAGELTCPSSVAIQRDPAAAKPAVAVIRPHQFEILRDAGSVTLRGEVPTATERERIISLAGGYFGRVDDQLQVSNEAAGPNYMPAADRAMAVLSHLASGQAMWSGDRLSVSGIADSANAAAARAEFDQAAASGMLGRFDVEVPEKAGDARRECNEAFGEILSGATIRFQTGSATIGAGNDELLQRLAGVASTCSGHLTIAGHTDSRGDADMNRALSLARASAVRDALAALGVETTRMNAVGYGEARPIADNGTAAGRARNRRIAITVDESE